MYGFHCTITGYPSSSQESNIRFEQELAWLSASACRILVQNPFQPVLINKCRYMSISAMPSYLNYSYEEIRLGFTQDTVARETVILKHKSSSTSVF
uniref:Myotubularin phosphatase domain-containing protein n=1 Tax=Heterorhabditis bacteriophora TaxID=37862 RepID=A0A1I7X5E4_HETBA